jgi:hypothetical protein
MKNLDQLFPTLRSSLLVRPRLRTPQEGEERHATWLELFYDLVVVAAVSSVAHALSEDHSATGMLVFAGLFIPVFWVWAGHTVYATRFDTDDLVYRLFTFLQMFAIVGMAVEVHDASQGETRAYSLAYLASGSSSSCSWPGAGRHPPPLSPHLSSGVRAGARSAFSSVARAGAVRPLGASLTPDPAVPWQVWRSMHPSPP